MDLEQQLRAALAPARPDARVRAAVMSRVSGAAKKAPGKNRPRIIFGTILIAVAAAAMLAALLLQPPPPVIAVTPLPEEAGPPVAVPPGPAVQVSMPAKISPAKVETPGEEKPLPRLLPPKRALPAPPDSTLAERAMVARYPELVNGPEIDSVTAVTITLNADGSVHSSDIKPMATGSDVRVPPSRISELMSGALSNMGRSSIRKMLQKGAAIADGAVLKGTVALTCTILPQGFDATRTVDLVQKALLASHSELLMPITAGTFNQLTVFMTEDGRVDRYYVRNKPQSSMRPYGDIEPERFAAEWEPLGLKPEQLGLMGITNIYEGSMPQRAPIPVGTDGLAHAAAVAGIIDLVVHAGGPTAVSDMRSMVVRYAWPRRDGEPIGGFKASVQPTNLSTAGASFSHADVAAVLDHHLPGALNDTGLTPMGIPSLVMNREGEVVRSGYIKQSGQIVNARFMELQNAGLHIAEFLQMPIVKQYGVAYSDRVIFAWLAP